jgi:type I restriction enzyme S subunit
MYSGRTIPLSEVALGRSDAFVDGPFGSNLKSEEYTETPEVRLIQLQNIGIGTWLDAESNYVTQRKARSLWRHAAHPGDIAIAKMADPVARACILPANEDHYLLVADCIKLQVDTKKFNPRFVVRVLNSHTFRARAESLSTGTTRLRINLSTLKQMHIPATELREQQRIADTIDSIDDDIKAEERLLAKLVILRDGIVRDALSRLTGNQRLASVASLFSIKAGITLGPDRQPRDNASKYLRVANVQRARIDLTDVALLQATTSEKAELHLAAGDLLVVEGHANSDEIGRCALVGEDAVGLLYQNHLFRLRSTEVDPEFAELWLNSDASRAYWHRMSATSSGLYTINSSMLRSLPFPAVTREAQTDVTNAQHLIANQIKATHATLTKLRLIKQGVMDDLLSGWVPFP